MVKLLADAGFTGELNLKYMAGEHIDAHFADSRMRSQDPRFKGAQKKHSSKSYLSKIKSGFPFENSID